MFTVNAKVISRNEFAFYKRKIYFIVPRCFVVFSVYVSEAIIQIRMISFDQCSGFLLRVRWFSSFYILRWCAPPSRRGQMSRNKADKPHTRLRELRLGMPSTTTRFSIKIPIVPFQILLLQACDAALNKSSGSLAVGMCI